MVFLSYKDFTRFLESLWLTFSPCVVLLADHRVFENQLTFETESVFQKPPFILLDATLAFYIFSLPFFIVSWVDYPKPPQKTSRISFTALQYFRISRALFFALFKRLERVALHSRSSTFRVWLPSSWFQLKKSLGASFNSQHSWASPFKALLLASNRQNVSISSFCSRTWFQNHHDLETVPQQLHLTNKSAPHFRPEDKSERGPDAFIGFRPLGFSHPDSRSISFSLIKLPSHP